MGSVSLCRHTLMYDHSRPFAFIRGQIDSFLLTVEWTRINANMTEMVLGQGNLFVAQRVDGVEPGGFAGGVEAEKNADRRADQEGKDDPFWRNERRPAELGGEQFRNGDAHANAQRALFEPRNTRKKRASGIRDHNFSCISCVSWLPKPPF